MSDMLMIENITHSRIKKLSPLLINQLAAGEVVTRPAAVVKELLENAIDAGATHIEVRITQGGMGMIEVIDNGVGIHPGDMAMALTRHATSKVADVAHLHGINTLGFRGEALAATAAVSRLTLSSSHNDKGIGRQLQVAGVIVDVPKLTPVVHSRGTTVTVKDLYFNVPARRGNLKSIATEFAHIETTVRDVALARADITLTLFHDNKKRLVLTANTNGCRSSLSDNNYLPLSRLEQALGLTLSKNMLEVSVDLSSLQQANDMMSETESTLTKQPAISGWLWPALDSTAPAVKLLYINGRLIKEPIISNQLRQLATAADVNNMSYALYFELPPQWLNINVHPSKQRIRISPLNNIMAHLNHYIAANLKSSIASIIPPVTSKTPSLELTVDRYEVDKPVHNDNRIKPLPAEHQVNSVKQSYQPAESSKLAATTNTVNLSADNDLEEATLSNDLLDDIPYCLEIVSDRSILSQLNRPQLYAESTQRLLFYCKGQLFIISTTKWYIGLNNLFENYPVKTNYNKIHAIDINQHINYLVNQMSVQDLRAFVADIKMLLTTQASMTLDSKCLMSMMVSNKAN